MIDFEFNELLSSYKRQLNEVSNRVIKLNKEFNKKDIRRIYNNTCANQCALAWVFFVH